MELVSCDGEFLVGECLLERLGFIDKRSFPIWVSDGCVHFGEAFVEGGFFTCIFLYSRRVSPWSSSSRLSLSWSLRCHGSRFLRSSNSSREVEYSSLGTTF